MKSQTFYFLLLYIIFLSGVIEAQDIDHSINHRIDNSFFESDQILHLKLSYSDKELKKETNDSTYLESQLSYQLVDGTWKTLDIEFRIRGNYRRSNCYFPPLKMKIKKSKAKGTVFEGNKKMKLVLPCLNNNHSGDDLLKEFIAYKLYEVVSPYYFKTRMIHFDLTQIKGKKTIEHDIYGFFIEDDKNLTKRFNGRERERFAHHSFLDSLSAVQNAFFQFMIGNTDYSMEYLHNEKLFLIDGKIIPVPYDFDMTGFVNPGYAVVSDIQNEELPITDVTQRLYRGFEREPELFLEVRKQFLDNKGKILEVMDNYKPYFNDPEEFLKAKDFISGFYDVLENDKKFDREIVNKARSN